MKKLIAISLLMLTALPVMAEVIPAPIFSDHVILQREMPVPIWGTAKPGEKITVSFRDQKVSTEADAKGRWRVRLAAMPAVAEPQELTITGDNTVTIKDVLVGEVWLCSGQSNMGGGGNAVALLRTRDFMPTDPPSTLARVCVVTSDGGPDHRRRLEPQEQLVCSGWSENKGGLTATWFGRILQGKLGIPVGIIQCAVSSSNIESWISEEGYAFDPEVAAAHAKDLADWAPIRQEVVEKGRDTSVNSRTVFNVRFPSGQYNCGIHPLIPYAIRGVAWYQGEQNTGEIYQKQMAALMADWRKRWGIKDLPMVFAQITTYGGTRPFPSGEKVSGQLCAKSASTTLLESQRKFAVSDGRAWLVPNMDLGGSLHPGTKPDIAARMVQAALVNVYGRPGEFTGPMFQKLTRNGTTVRIEFSHAKGLFAAEGLTVDKTGNVLDPPNSSEVLKLGEDGVFVLNNFAIPTHGIAMRRRPNQPVRGICVAIGGKTSVWQEVDARIEGETIVATVPEDATHISGGFPVGANPMRIANVYNEAELPMLNFMAPLDPSK